MTGVVARKLLAVIPVLLAVSFLTFLMMDLLPGCVECQILGPDAMDEQAVEAVREDLRLDDPLPVRYVAWLGDALTGDLGQSYYTRQEVTEAIVERLPVTVEIVVVSMVLALVLAIPLGIVTAYRAGGFFDRFVTGATLRAAGGAELHDGAAADLPVRGDARVAAGHRVDAASPRTRSRTSDR